MMLADRVALGLLELLVIAILLLVAINYFTSPFPIIADRAYGLLIGGVSLVIIPLWLVMRLAERRRRRQR